jgi:hypothetical protein
VDERPQCSETHTEVAKPWGSGWLTYFCIRREGHKGDHKAKSGKTW